MATKKKFENTPETCKKLLAILQKQFPDMTGLVVWQHEGELLVRYDNTNLYSASMVEQYLENVEL